jgi:tetratricopeptide (TPR) repeat protein
VLLGFLGLTTLPRLAAHDSPEHMVELLTAHMETVGRRPDLLWRRATEYRALSKLPEAERDLRAAIRLKKDFFPAIMDLSRVQLARGNSRGAGRTIQRAMAFDPTGQSKAELLMLQGENFGAAGRLAEAVQACDAALASAETVNPEWYLARCQFQYRLGQFEAAAVGLRQGMEKTGNAVLEAEWIDAAIDAGHYQDVLSPIATRLAESRCQASWLIRRGRTHEGLGRISEAQKDYLSALAELNGRMGSPPMDFTILAERGLVYALLGDLQLARLDLSRARELGGDDWALNRLERATREYNAGPVREKRAAR